METYRDAAKKVIEWSQKQSKAEQAMHRRQKWKKNNERKEAELKWKEQD